MLHEKELAEARNCEPFERFGYSDETWDRAGSRSRPISGDIEFAKNLWLFETPGHTIGHYSLLAKPSSDGRGLLFAVDVVYTGAALEKGVQPGFHYDPVAGVRSIQRLRDLATEHDAEILFSHDMDAWHTYRHAPDFYEL